MRAIHLVQPFQHLDVFDVIAEGDSQIVLGVHPDGLDQSDHRPPVQRGYVGELLEVLGPPQAGTAVVRHQLHLGPQTVNGLLRLLRQLGVEIFQILIVFFADKIGDKIFVQRGLELTGFFQLCLVIRNLPLELCDFLLIDLFLANAVQNLIQRAPAVRAVFLLTTQQGFTISYKEQDFTY